jgi:hypothetical protein
MLKQFPPSRNYMALTLRDLLEARDAYHVHLAHLSNVVGTAVGRYLIREDDWYASHATDEAKPKHAHAPSGPRTLFNTVIRDWSWPCVLVFVNRWSDKRDFGASPDQMVPRALFLPDGRVIPTCVVLVEEGPAAEPSLGDLSFPESYVGGGYVALTDVQGRQHVGSFGCLVTDGNLTYALTNRHVTGAAGSEIFTMLRDRKTRVGVSSALQADCKRFTDMYPGWPGGNVQLRLDAGLIAVDDLDDWTTQVLGMGALDELMDLTEDSLTLGFIDSPVTAFGAASGLLDGRVAALFYRYRSVGGADYVTEFLIRPDRFNVPGTVHGDSGTLWFWKQPDADEEPARLRPFAMQWGGHLFVDSTGTVRRTGHFALAASLSTVCRELSVSPVRDWNSGLPEYWGDVGHYTIGLFACDRVTGNLRTLMNKNQEVIAYPSDDLISSKAIKIRGDDGFVRLADVPDRIWKIPGGDGARGYAENGNHFADMDKPLPDDPDKGKTLLELCEDETNVDPAVWLGYYKRVHDSSRGILPFRVWQFFDALVDAASKKDTTRFVCAAGILAHYVGDSCQPLHISYMFNGEPVVGPDGKTTKRGEGVHEAYESRMLTKNAVELLALLRNELARDVAAIKVPKSGKDAACAAVALMTRTFKTLPPLKIVNAFDKKRDLWADFKQPTVQIMADGIRTLAAIWQGAWRAGGGTHIASSKLALAETKALMDLYKDTAFVKSFTLADIGAVLK